MMMVMISNHDAEGSLNLLRTSMLRWGGIDSRDCFSNIIRQGEQAGSLFFSSSVCVFFALFSVLILSSHTRLPDAAFLPSAWCLTRI